MGLYDRDYTQYQDPQPRFGGGVAEKPAWLILLVITVALYLLDGILFSRDHTITEALALRSDTISAPLTWWRWLTYGFAHDPQNFNHLLFNMLGLFFFGSAVEQRLGRGEFTRFYLVAIIVGGIVFSIRGLLMEQFSDTGGGGTVVGASGGVQAIVILFCCFYPSATLYLFFVLPVKAWIAGLLFVAIDLYGVVFGAGPVASDVHLAGIGFAVAYYFGRWRLDFLGLQNLQSQLTRWRSRPPRLRLHDPEKKMAQEAAEADRILEKIHQQGEASLTGAERKLLERYSRRIRQRDKDR